MFSLEIIIPIIVVAAVCAVYIILRGRGKTPSNPHGRSVSGGGRRHAPCA